MAPIRRYLRITKYSVLEVRIYLDNPADGPWLTDTRGDVLPRVFQAIRPLVLPKLREEYERAKGSKSKRPKGVKDTVIEEDFEVGIFLTEQSTHHSLLVKQKDFHDKKGRIKSNSGKLTGWLDKETDGHSREAGGDQTPVVIREESDEEGGAALDRFPEAQQDPVVVEDDISDDEGFQTQSSPKPQNNEGDDEAENNDDKKKLGMTTSYKGFSIYGRVLCLMIKRKGARRSGTMVGAGGPQMLENWVSTQAAQEVPALEDD